MARIIKGLLRNSSSPGNNITLILLAVWAASRAQFSLMRIANYTYSNSRSTGNFLKERLRSLKTMVMTILTIAFVLVVLIYGKKKMKSKYFLLEAIPRTSKHLHLLTSL